MKSNICSHREKSTLGATAVAALTTRPRKVLWCKGPALSGATVANFTVDGFSPSYEGTMRHEMDGVVR